MDTITQHEWQAEEYHSNSGVQQEAALNLVKLLELKGSEEILDVGCGDGKITVKIANSLAKGSILGVDASEEMIKFASYKFPTSKNSKFKFILQSAQNIDYFNRFDIVFSSFVLQWVLEIEMFFKKAYDSLTQNGRIACTIPLSISDVLEDSLTILLKDPQWAQYFDGFTLNYYLRDENFYEAMLTKYGFAKSYFKVVDQEWIFPSRGDFEKYTLMWLPHLSVIPDNLKEQFFCQLMDKYVELNPLNDDGSLSFLFQRVDFIANKISNF